MKEHVAEFCFYEELLCRSSSGSGREAYWFDGHLGIKDAIEEVSGSN